MSLQHSTKLNDHLPVRQTEPYGVLLWIGLTVSSIIFISIFIFCFLKVRTFISHHVLLPDMFWLSTLFMLFSSILLHEAYISFQQERFSHYRIFLGTTLALGFIFLFLQIWGWIDMYQSPDTLHRHASISYIYLLSGLHFIYALVGVVFMSSLFQKALLNRSYIDSFIYWVNPPHQLKIRLFARYWHFVDASWIIVFLFIVLFFQ